MIIYHYEPTTGAYVGQGQATESPVEPGQYLIPAYATTVAPPEVQPAHTAVWDGAAWGVAEDHRGRRGYDTESGMEREITALGSWPADLAPDPKPGPAYTWDGQAWVYHLSLDPPGPEYDWDEAAGAWVRVRFSRKDFLLRCGFAKITALNAAITAGNMVAKTVYDLLFTSEYVDLANPDTVALVSLLATPEGGAILTPSEMTDILTPTARD